MSLNKISINDTTTVNTGIVYDISKVHNGATYTDLADALGTDGENVPLEVREGGMSVRFIRTSVNKYVQYRLMATSFSTSESDWQGVDDEPTAGSDNLVKSGGVKEELESNKTEIDSRLTELEFYQNVQDNTNITKPGYLAENGTIGALSSGSVCSYNIQGIAKAYIKTEIPFSKTLKIAYATYNSEGVVVQKDPNPVYNGNFEGIIEFTEDEV